MRLDLSADSVAWDQTESITLEVSTRAAPDLVAVNVAKRSNIRSAQKSPSGGVYLGFESRWRIPRRELPEGVIPKPADVVVDNEDQRWTVLTAEQNRLGETYALGCVNLSLAHQLRDVVVIERATISYDGAGAATKTFNRVLYTVAARVQELTREVAEERGVRYGKGRYEVTVDRQLHLLDVAEDRVRFVERVTGTVMYLDITGYRQPERIDDLPVVECELR